MPIYRVRWEEQKSIVVNAEDEEHARHLAYDAWYEKATLEEQGEVGIYEVDGCNGDEQIWSDESNFSDDLPVWVNELNKMRLDNKAEVK
jgi:hypothetical protein